MKHQAVIDEKRHGEVWLGDIVRIGAGRTEWTVTQADRKLLALVSPKGTNRWAVREQVTLLRRCPDGPQLEDWPDGRAYHGAELVYASQCLSDTIVWWRDEPISAGHSWPNGVSLSVCTPSPRDGDQELLEVAAFGTDDGSAVLRREDVLRLADSLLRTAARMR